MAITDDLHPDLTYRVVGAAIKVHRALGPGLLEKTYRRCLEHQLAADGMAVESEVPIDIDYEGLHLDAAYYADLVVEGTVLVELKAVEQLHAVHGMQTLTYLKLARLPVGLLINFNVVRLTAGLRHFANTRSVHPQPRNLTHPTPRIPPPPRPPR